MGEKTIDNLNNCIKIFIILYFVILAAERIQSLVRAGSKNELMTDGLHKYMTVLCIFSFVGTIGMLIAMGAMSKNASDETMLALLCAAVGCILLSGMVHTEYTIPGIQFGAYGMLIIAMALKVVTQQDILTSGKRAIVLIYLVAFSMAIPVVYASQIKNKTVFHITESIVSFALVVVFAIMLYLLFEGKYQAVMHPLFIIVALIGDILVLALRWKEQVNGFVLVALALAVVLYLPAKLMIK